MSRTTTTADKRRYLKLLRAQRIKANAMLLAAETPALRENWNQLGLALGWAIELAQADLAREERR